MKDPHDVIKAGDVVKVKVLEVDVSRKRISLTMRLNDEIPVAAESAASAASKQGARPKQENRPSAANRNPNRKGGSQPHSKGSAPANAAMGNALAAAFANAKKN